jgi:hypothetical protein
MATWKIIKANADNEREQHNRILREIQESTEASFETVSKNLSASGATFNYAMDRLDTIVYANGITKTFNFTGDKLTSIVLSGTTPAGVSLTKTLGYTGDSLTSVSYS